MLTHLEIDIENIKMKIFNMADLSIEAVSSAIASLKKGDIKLSKKIVQNDSLIDQLEIDIDNECIKILATRQPAATDLRFILAILKVNTDLERIADLAVNIAHQVLQINGQPLIKPLVDIPRMGEIAVDMIKESFVSITEKSVEKAKAVIAMDDEIDKLNMQVNRELFTYMVESFKNIPQSLSLIAIAKALERIGDHATNIAERAVYYIQGDDIRHKSIKVKSK
jgi:phosphate transport system protein